MSGTHVDADDAAHAHGATDGHDDHGHDGSELGPIDRLAWSFAALGIFLGLVIAAAFLAAGT